VTVAYISLASEAELAFFAAEQRLAKAREDVAHLLISRSGSDAFAQMLAIELDEAERFYRKCEADLSELRANDGR
jgi:hypothetical protein